MLTITLTVASPITLSGRSAISTGRLIATTSAYAIIQRSDVQPIPERIVTIRVVPAIGIAGQPIAAQMERNVIRFVGVMSFPDAVAINVTANLCITVVPFMLMVIPVGRTKLVISWEHPSSSRHVLVFSGRHAAEEFVENPNTQTFAIFLRNFIGLKPVVRPIPIG